MSTASLFKKQFLRIAGCCIFFALAAADTHAQQRGKVEVIKDPLVDTLINRWDDLNKGVVRSSSYGYRVQIFNGASRKEAYDAQAQFQSDHPGVRTYISFRDPNFKVHVGDFRSKLEAQKMVEELKPFFSGMLIIPGKINLTN